MLKRGIHKTSNATGISGHHFLRRRWSLTMGFVVILALIMSACGQTQEPRTGGDREVGPAENTPPIAAGTPGVGGVIPPEITDIPELAETPEAAETSEAAETPDAAETSEAAETPEAAETSEAAETPETGLGEEVGITVADIVSEPDRFISQTVTISGEVDFIYADYAFTIDEQSLREAGIDQDLLIIMGSTIGFTPTTGTTGMQERTPTTEAAETPGTTEETTPTTDDTETPGTTEELTPTIGTTGTPGATEEVPSTAVISVSEELVGERLEITGVVTRLNPTEIEQTTGVNLPLPLKSAHEDQPVIVAQFVRRVR